MKILRFFALLLVFTVFCAESEKTTHPPVEEQKQVAQKEQKIIKQAKPDSTVLQEKLAKLEQRKQQLEEKEQALSKQKQKLAALQDSLDMREKQLDKRESKLKQLNRNSWWTLTIGIILIIIALILFIVRPRPPKSKSETTKTAEHKEPERKDQPEKDPLYEQAVEFVLKNQNASISRLQKELGVGRTRINHLLDTMQNEGLVGPSRPNRAREVLSTWDDYQKP